MYSSSSDIKGTSCTSVVTTLCDEISSDVDQVIVPMARKILYNGSLYIILEDGRVYDMMGGRH
jgi:hypothetical protein